MYHCHFQIINRASGRSSVAAAAYRSGEKLINHRDGVTHDYSRKGGIAYTAVLLPEKAPPSFSNREKLWNEVERVERRKDAQTARELELALPVELNQQEQVSLLKDYLQENFVSQGMCADIALHDKNDGNPHAHVLLTLRSVDNDGFGKKDRSWNDRANVEYWRSQWADIYNQKLATLGINDRVDHRSFKRQGLDIQPTIHLGSAAHQLEKRGIATERGDLNHQIRAQNAHANYLDEQLSFLESRQQKVFSESILELSNLKNQYLNQALALSEHQNAKQTLETDLRQTQGQAKDLNYRLDLLSQYDRRLSDLKTSRPVFLADPESAQISQLEKAQQQALFALNRDYHLAPDKVPSKLKS